MKRIAVGGLLVGLVPVLIAADHSHSGSTAAKEEATPVYVCPMHSRIKATWPAKCPKCGMDLVKAKSDTEALGGSVALKATDPAVILARQEQLQLTPEQVQRLEAVAQKARQEAEGILTAEQRQTLRSLTETVPSNPSKESESKPSHPSSGHAGCKM